MTAATPVARLDAYAKVRGEAIFAADRTAPDMAYAMFAIATIPKGRLVSLDTAAAEAVPGVLRVFTHEDTDGVQSPGFLFSGDGFGVQSLQPLVGTTIAYRGQPIAMAVATSLEAAIEAASLVEATYEEEPISVTMDAPGAESILQAEAIPIFPDSVLGDADGGFAESEVQIDETYDAPPQHQNPMELIATVAEWRDGTLIIQEGTQYAGAIRSGLARQLGIDAASIEVESPYAGGGFGQKNSLQPQTVLAALAARELDRPVKLVVPRAQIFHDGSFRPASRHRVRLGGDRSGRFSALIHETHHQTSRFDLFPAFYTLTSGAMYGVNTFRGEQHLVRLDTQTTGYMRAPFEHPTAFALESAVDAYAAEIGMDPVVLRLANDTQVEPISGLPFSSRHVAECLQRGAERFGWANRSLQPGSMRDDDGNQVGWGVAIGCYPAWTTPAIAHLRLSADGIAEIAVTGHEMGQGIGNVIAPVVARELAIPIEQVTVTVGKTQAAPQILTAGSWGTATAVPVVRRAIAALREELAQIDPEPDLNRYPLEVLAAAGRSEVAVEARNSGPGAAPEVFDLLEAGILTWAGPIYPEFAAFSYAATFVEVRVEESTRRVRVPRVLNVVDCGRVMSPVTAASQVRGGVVWGISASLREVSEVDDRFGGFLNADIAEYLIPVNADIGEIEVEFIDRPDPLLNEDGVKGLGEISMVSVGAAVANAVFHATGTRVRHLPIRIEDLLPEG